MNPDTAFDRDRIHEIARKAGALRSLYLGEAIGGAIAMAWEGLAAAGARIRGAVASIARRGRPRPL